ncbi:MAG: aromatic amino acid lyase, partial [Hyphomicrobiales bacterium]|nr:aromatic amino acid lyase [Hyphomicrobiales bacterium]
MVQASQGAPKRVNTDAARVPLPASLCRLGPGPLRIPEIVAVARRDARVELAPELTAKLAAARGAIERAAARGDTVYGLTTALGAAVDTRLDAADLGDFQRRTLR